MLLGGHMKIHLGLELLLLFHMWSLVQRQVIKWQIESYWMQFKSWPQVSKQLFGDWGSVVKVCSHSQELEVRSLPLV